MKTVEHYIERPGTRRKRRRMRFLWLAFAAVFAVGLFASWFIVRSGFFAVREFHIQGAAPFSDADILLIAETAIFKNAGWEHALGIQNLLVWPSKIAGSDLALTPKIAGMAISKSYFGKTVDISVDIRKPSGIWCDTDNPHASDGTAPSFSCFSFDKTGFAFDNAPHAEGGLVHVVDDYMGRNIGIGKPVLPERFIPALFSVFDVLAQSKIGVKEIRLENLGLEEIKVATYDGPTILFSLRFDAGNTTPVLVSLMLRSGFGNLQYVDFRTEDRAYYR